MMNKKSEVINRYNTFQRNPSFLGLKDAEFLLAFMYYNSENTSQDIKFTGDNITNQSAAVKLDEVQLAEVKNVFFT